MAAKKATKDTNKDEPKPTRPPGQLSRRYSPPPPPEKEKEKEKPNE